MKHWAVMGAGALGMLLAGKLAASGCPVQVWTRTEEQARLIREHGLTVEDGASGSSVQVEAAAAAYREVPPGFSGTVLLAVKQTALTPVLMQELAETLSQDARLVSFQNGVSHMEALSEALPGRLLAAAVTTEGALRTGPSAVRRTGAGQTWIGEWEPGAAENAEWLDEIGRMLKQAGFSVSVSKEIRERMLRKLLINAVINPLSALWRVRNGELPGTPERKAAMQALFRETADILEERGLRETETGELWENVLGVCASTAENRSSMLQDVLAGRETEIAALNGAVCRMARAAGRPAPWNAAVTALVQAILSPKERGL